MTPTYRCPACATRCETTPDGLDRVSLCCDEVAERINVCACGNEAHAGCDECFACVVAAVIADPRELEQCTEELAREIGVALAQRLQPYLSRRQAA